MGASSEPYLKVQQWVTADRAVDETVFLDRERGCFYSLDAIGTRMFELACASMDGDAVVDLLAGEYEASVDQLRSDLEALVDELEEHGLVVRNTTSSGSGESGS